MDNGNGFPRQYSIRGLHRIMDTNTSMEILSGGGMNS